MSGQANGDAPATSASFAGSTRGAAAPSPRADVVRIVPARSRLRGVPHTPDDVADVGGHRARARGCRSSPCASPEQPVPRGPAQRAPVGRRCGGLARPGCWKARATMTRTPVPPPCFERGRPRRPPWSPRRRLREGGSVSRPGGALGPIARRSRPGAPSGIEAAAASIGSVFERRAAPPASRSHAAAGILSRLTRSMRPRRDGRRHRAKRGSSASATYACRGGERERPAAFRGDVPPDESCGPPCRQARHASCPPRPAAAPERADEAAGAGPSTLARRHAGRQQPAALQARDVRVHHHGHQLREARPCGPQPSSRRGLGRDRPAAGPPPPAGRTRSPPRTSASRARRGRRRPPPARARCASRRCRSRSRPARLLQHPPHRVDVVAGEAPVAPRVEVAQPELVASPSLIRATPSVTLRVTNSMPRRGDSWLNRIPLTANSPYLSR